MNNHKLRASYSYLNLWSTGRWEDAIKGYFKLDRFITRQMAEGSDFHEEWGQHIEKTKTLPAVFGGAPLQNPVCEEKTVIPVYDWLDLVIKPDCVDIPIIHEFKTGTMESDDYARSYQPAVYAAGYVLLNRPVHYVDIHQYNQYSKKATYSRVVITVKLLTAAWDWIETVASEMHSYFVENELYEKYGKGQA